MGIKSLGKEITIINDYELMNNETEVRILRGISAVDDPRRWKLVNKKEEFKMEIGKTYVNIYGYIFIPESKLSDGSYAGMCNYNPNHPQSSLVPALVYLDSSDLWTLKKNKKTYWHCVYKRLSGFYGSALYEDKSKFETVMDDRFNYTIIKEFETEIEEDA